MDKTTKLIRVTNTIGREIIQESTIILGRITLFNWTFLLLPLRTQVRLRSLYEILYSQSTPKIACAVDAEKFHTHLREKIGHAASTKNDTRSSGEKTHAQCTRKITHPVYTKNHARSLREKSHT